MGRHLFKWVLLVGLCMTLCGCVRPRDEYQERVRRTEERNARLPQPNDEDRSYWLKNMIWHHRFSNAEVTAAAGLNSFEIAKYCEKYDIRPNNKPKRPDSAPLLALPYPGGRHPRIGFLDGAIDPQRETKVSIFTPWDDSSYVVVDVPEAIWSNFGLMYLAHTHVATMWDDQGLTLEKLEWNRNTDGSLTMSRWLPNKVSFHAKVQPERDRVLFALALRNLSELTVSDLRVQVCTLLKGAKGFNSQTSENKLHKKPYIACRNDAGDKWIITAWTECIRTWDNPPCPCMHSDPQLPDCPPNELRRVRGALWFYQGEDIDGEIRRLDGTDWRDAAM